MYLFKRSLLPNYFRDMFTLASQIHSYNTRNSNLGAGTRTNNKLNPHMTPRPGIEPGPHWWEASALTTAPSLLPHIPYTFYIPYCRTNLRKFSIRF